MARPGLLYILNQPLLRNVVAQEALRNWYTHRHVPALLSLNLGLKNDKHVYCYQSVDPDRSGPGGFLSLCPTSDTTELGKTAVQNVLSGEKIVLPLSDDTATAKTAQLFALPQRPVARRELEKDPREGGAHLRQLEKERCYFARVEYVENPAEPPPDDVPNPYEHFLDSGTAYDFDTIDYQNTADFDRDQDFRCILEAPSESSEPHYMDSSPNVFAGPVPPEGLPIEQAMMISSQLYEEVLRSDTQASETSPIELAPYLLLARIPSRLDLSEVQNSAAFVRHFKRYPYLTGRPVYRRHKCYRRIDASHSGWLMIQEFDDPSDGRWVEWDEGWFELKKQEAKAWWKRQGYRDAKLDFYRLVETFGPESAFRQRLHIGHVPDK